MCRPNCTTPDFQSLPRITGVHPQFREVHGVWMTEEEYRVTGWHSRGTYPVSGKGTDAHISGSGTDAHQWIAPLGGHIEWARITYQRREQRISAAVTRRDRDEEYSAAVLADIDRRDPR